jgi:hypothetical protein
MSVKAAFQFYFETEVNTNFLKCAKLSLLRGEKTWYRYIDPKFKIIQTIKILDDDEFMIVSYSKTGYSPPNPGEAADIDKKAAELQVLCKSCYWMNVLDAKPSKYLKKGNKTAFDVRKCWWM